MRILLALLLFTAQGWSQPKTETGEINGAKFRIDVPEKWSGGLVMYCHGYSPAPGGFDNPKPNPVLDVFTKEPLDPDSPYWDLPNVIVTPHISGAMEDYWTPLVALFSENLRRFEHGQPLLNVVDKRAGY